VGPEKRRDKRFKFQIPGSIVRRQGLVPVLTGDVGFRGVLLRTDAPPPLRELIVLRFALPPGGDPIELHALAVWNVPPGIESRVPGVGVQFYAVPTETQKRWNQFVRWVERNHPESTAQAVPSAPGLLDPVRRVHERIDVSLSVRVHDATGSRELTTRHVSRSGMYVWMAPPAEVGTVLGLELVHPSTGAPLQLTAIVRNATAESGRTGVGLEFVDVDEAKRDEVMAFVAAAPHPAKAENPVFVAPGDPRLDRPGPDEDLFANVDLSDG
jgi:hypothetical protein